MEIDLKRVKPYGDALNDGAVQLSFTLPVPSDERAEEAAKQLARKMGFRDVGVAHRNDLGDGFTFFVVYGRTSHAVNVADIEVPKVETPRYSYYEVNERIEKIFGRKLVVVGACTGSDAHTVGIDAIMNMKGYNQHYGLERYPWVEATNLGSQVPNEDLLRYAIDHEADAVLVSQVVTAKDSHIHTLTEFIELAESFGVRDRMTLVVGGPRINHRLAVELGFDAGFGPGTYAEHVASFILEDQRKRLGMG